MKTRSKSETIEMINNDINSLLDSQYEMRTKVEREDISQQERDQLVILIEQNCKMIRSLDGIRTNISTTMY